MKQQWTIGTTMFHTITGDKDMLEAKKDEILEAINASINAIVDIPDISAGIDLVETHVSESVLESTTDIENN